MSFVTGWQGERIPTSPYLFRRSRIRCEPPRSTAALAAFPHNPCRVGGGVSLDPRFRARYGRPAVAIAAIFGHEKPLSQRAGRGIEGAGDRLANRQLGLRIEEVQVLR